MALDSEAFEDFLGEEVVNSVGNPIGTLACYWEHEEGKPVLLGIDLGALSNEIHIVPAKNAQLDTRKSYVAVEFSKEKVRNAPILDCGSELTPQLERSVMEYYGESALGYSEAETETLREFKRKNHSVSKP